MSDILTSGAPTSPPLPAPWEASLQRLLGEAADLGTLHGVNIAKLQVLIAIRDQLAIIAGHSGGPFSTELTPKSKDDLSTGLGKAITGHLEDRFTHLRQALDAGEAARRKADAEIERLSVGHAIAEDRMTAFRGEIFDALQRIAEDLERLRQPTVVAVIESETLVEETSDPPADADSGADSAESERPHAPRGGHASPRHRHK